MGVLDSLREGFASLNQCSREVYALLALNVLESFNYFSLSIVITDYLTSSFGASDVEAGSLYGAWGAAIVGAGVLLGPAIDALGVRRSLLLSAATTAAARAALATVTSRHAAIFILLVPMSLGGALGGPVLSIGCKRAAPPGPARGFVFSLLYAAMNIAAFFAGMLRDTFLIGSPRLGLKPAGVRAYVGLGAGVALAEVLLVLVAVHGRPPVVAGAGSGDGGGTTVAASGGGTAGSGGAPTTTRAALPAGAAPSPSSPSSFRRLSSLDGMGLADGGPTSPPRPPGRLAAALASFRASLAAVAGPELYKFVAMSLVCINLRAVFRFLDAVLPKSIVRTFGCAAPAGRIYAINPALICLLVPPVGAALSRFEPFDLIHWGAYLSALSPLAIVARPHSLGGAAAFVAVLSVGEAVWSPQWSNYSMEVAPDGHEGLFTALASAPLFAAKLPTGALSGWLLEKYCRGNGPCPGPGDPSPVPAPGACDPAKLWGTVAAITVSSPLTILVFHRWLRPAKKGGGPADYRRVGSADSGGGGGARVAEEGGGS